MHLEHLIVPHTCGYHKWSRIRGISMEMAMDWPVSIEFPMFGAYILCEIQILADVYSLGNVTRPLWNTGNVTIFSMLMATLWVN